MKYYNCHLLILKNTVISNFLPLFNLLFLQSAFILYYFDGYTSGYYYVLLYNSILIIIT